MVRCQSLVGCSWSWPRPRLTGAAGFCSGPSCRLAASPSPTVYGPYAIRPRHRSPPLLGCCGSDAGLPGSGPAGCGLFGGLLECRLERCGWPGMRRSLNTRALRSAG
jgi:hypothetical protein